MNSNIGRLDTDLVGKVLPHDAPETVVAAILSKQDEIIDKLNSLLVAVEAATDGNTLFTGLDAAGIKATLAKLEFKL